MKRFAWVLFAFILPLSILGQNKDSGSVKLPDINAVKRGLVRSHAADSTHHSDTVHYHFSFIGTGTVNNTNINNSYLLSNAFTFSIVKKSATINFNNSWVYGESGNALTNNDFTSNVDVDLYKTLRHFYYWGLANYTTSVSLKIIQQEQVGAGLGYNLVDKKKAVVILSDGPLYERGDLYDIYVNGMLTNQRDMYHVIRNSFRLKFRFIIQDIITLSGTEFYQNAITDGGNYILKLNTDISVRLHKWLSLTVSANYNRFTRTRSENTILTYGLTVQL